MSERTGNFDWARRQESYRAGTEDRSAAYDRGDSLVVVVADGVGGLPGGAEAAEAVVRGVSAALGAIDVASPRAWADLLTRVDRELFADPGAGQTTAVVAVLFADRVVGASAGDSAAWMIGDETVQYLTHAQDRSGFLGGGSLPRGFSGPPEGTLLAATDGLVKYASPETIARLARGEDLTAAAEALIDAARLPTTDLVDDVAVVLARRRRGAGR